MRQPSLRRNILALGSVQLGNLLVPLLTLPYLTRVLGPVVFGHLVFVQVVMAFFILFVDFGFSLSATRDIAENRSDHVKVSMIFASTWVAQWLLLLIGCLVLLVLVMWLPSMHAQAGLYLVGYGLVLGNVLCPVWLLQGLENMKAVAVVQLSSKLVTLPLFFLMVKEPADQLWSMTIFSLGSVLAGLLCLLWLFHARIVSWYKPGIREVIQALQDGGVLFLSKFSISLYTTMVPLVVGLVAGTTQLGFFNLAEKVKGLMLAMIAPISQALFPRMSFLFNTNVAQAKALLRISALAVLLAAGVAGLVVFVQAEKIAILLGGDEFSAAAEILRWMAFVPMVVAASNILGIQIMLPLGMNKGFASILSLASVVSMALVYPVVQRWQGLGAAQLVLFIEVLVTLMMAAYLSFHNHKRRLVA